MSTPKFLRRKAAHLCIRCGTCRPRRGRSTCSPCASKQAAWYQQKDRCRLCKKRPSIPGSKSCVECRTKTRERHWKYEESFLEQGICQFCREASDILVCNKCSTIKKALRRSTKKLVRLQRIADGLCPRCGIVELSADYSYSECEACRTLARLRDASAKMRRAKAQQAAVDEGFCMRCHKYRTKNGKKTCEKCIAYGVEMNRQRRKRA